MSWTATNVVIGIAAMIPRLPMSVRTISVAIVSSFRTAPLGWWLTYSTMISGSPTLT